MQRARQCRRIREIAALLLGAVLTCAAAAQVTLSVQPTAPTDYQTDYSFDFSHGSMPGAQLLQTRDGKFYGTTQFGGAYGTGALFRIEPSSARIKVLHSFIQDGHDGFQPVGNLVEDESGAIFGTTSFGGAYYSGTVFRLSEDGDYQVVHAFQGGPTDGAQSYSALVKASDGYFYGTTAFGGAYGQGCVFKMSRRGDLAILYSFAGPDGAFPQWGLTLGSGRALYGTTVGGGANGAGTIFKITTAGAFSSLYSLSPGIEGVYPSHLTLAKDGVLYATTPSGGPGSGGTVFAMNSAGTVSLVYAFVRGAPDGDSPSGLMQAADGNFWGTNANFASDQLGTVFKMTPAGVVTTIHRFAPGSTANPYDGRQPLAPPMEAKNGVLYGTTSLGGIPGQSGYGTIYQIKNP